MSWFKLSSRDVAFVAVFAALSAIVCRIVPGIPIVGVSDSSIQFDAALAPIYGLVVGPYLGFLAGLLGGIVVASSWLSVFTSFCTAISALVAGLLTQKNFRSSGHSIRGWVVASAVLGLLILGWYATPIGQEASLYPVLHFLGIAIILVFRGWVAASFEKGDEKKEKSWVSKPNYLLSGILIAVLGFVISKSYFVEIWEYLPYVSILLYFLSVITILYGLFGGRSFMGAVFFACYCGIIADHMLGSLIYREIYGIPPEVFTSILPIAAIERFVFTTIATLIGVALVLTLRRAGFFPRRLQQGPGEK
jgi:hypothetical protein